MSTRRNLWTLGAALGVALALALVGAEAAAQSPPSCNGATCDWTDGDGHIQLPSADDAGDAYLAGTVVSCTMDFGVFGSSTVSGAPGATVSFSVPKDGTVNVSASCKANGLTGGAATTAATFPPFGPPGVPILLP